MDLFLSEEHQIFRDQIRRFCEVEIAPLVEDAEETETFPKKLFPMMGKLGYLAVRYPEKYGGAGVDKLTDVILREEMSRVCQGIASSWSSHSHLATFPIYHEGTEDQKRNYLTPAIKGEKIGGFALSEPNSGSDVRSIQSFAKKDGDHYILNGSKTFITNAPIADFLTTAAYTDKSQGYRGISIFIVDCNTLGLTISKLKKEGIRSSETGEIAFEDCPVPEENLIGLQEGNYKLILETLSEGRIGVAGNMVGVAQAAYEASQRYAKERIQFGKPIGKFQAISHKIADMAVQMQAARLMVYAAAKKLDMGVDSILDASAAKLFASEVAVSIAREAVQIFGGYGFMREYPVFRYLRDALVYTVGEGTSEIQKNIIAKQIGL
ncbi:MAG TPA: acyl-CoA dehydrogenase family protein [Desulfatiglandales bacterium]|nr:acyl-CoA dehydrogenase family protein [Desulfatiglandales bacterium]